MIGPVPHSVHVCPVCDGPLRHDKKAVTSAMDGLRLRRRVCAACGATVYTRLPRETITEVAAVEAREAFLTF